MAKKKHTQKQQQNQERRKENSWHRHPATWIVPLAILVILLLGWMSWKPVNRWLSSVANTEPNPQASTEIVTLDRTGSGGGQTQTPVVITNNGSGSNGSSGGGESGTGSGGGGGNGGSSGGSSTQNPSLLADLYKEIENGETFSEVEKAVGVPDDCIETLLSALGLQKVCTWQQDGSSMIVTFIDDQVVSRTKIGF